MAQYRFQDTHAMAKPNDVRVQHHTEIATPLVLGIKLL
jgi:predicted alpha/beta-hydrolase family hydrolase